MFKSKHGKAAESFRHKKSAYLSHNVGSMGAGRGAIQMH